MAVAGKATCSSKNPNKRELRIFIIFLLKYNNVCIYKKQVEGSSAFFNGHYLGNRLLKNQRLSLPLVNQCQLNWYKHQSQVMIDPIFELCT